MKVSIKKLGYIVAVAAISFVLVGCGTEQQKITEAVTEAKTERITEVETEAKTEKMTQTQTEVPTEMESETTQTESETMQTESQVAQEGPVVVVDAGHQGPGQDMSRTEPNGPGSSVMKARLATGTSGSVSGLAEYELNLEVSLQLEQELKSRGYKVIMTRTDHDIDIGNIERADIANQGGADILVRIHANGSEDGSVGGALTMAPSASNPYMSAIYEECMRLSTSILDQYCEATGLINRGILAVDDMTGINWSQVPVTIVEMGFMTNAGDDSYMADSNNQIKMVQGIADGIDDYFGR